MSSVELEKAIAAGKHLEAFFRGERSDNGETMRQASPHAGYGRDYPGANDLNDIAIDVYHFIDQNFLDCGIPSPYPSPKAFLRRVKEFRAALDQYRVDLSKIKQDAVSYYKTERGVEHIPMNIEWVSSMVQKADDAAEYAESLMVAAPAPRANSIVLLDQIGDTFKAAHWYLVNRRKGKGTFEVTDEYDVQDLFIAMMRTMWNNIKREEPVPATAGSSSSVDAYLPAERLFVEFKHVGPTLSASKLKEQIARDMTDFPAHPGCGAVYYYVYDPEGRMANPRGFEADIENAGYGVPITCRIRPL